jgi:predicted dinucleotide-binding enzyme
MCAVTFVNVTYTLSKAEAHTGGSLMVVVTVPDPDVVGRFEFIVLLPQPGEKAAAIAKPNSATTGAFDKKR